MKMMLLCGMLLGVEALQVSRAPRSQRVRARGDDQEEGHEAQDDSVSTGQLSLKRVARGA